MISVAPVGIFGFGVVRVIQGRSDWSVMAVRLKRLFYKNKTAVGTGPEIFGRLAIFVFVPMVTVRLCLADFFTLSTAKNV